MICIIIITKNCYVELMQEQKKKSIFSIFDELSENFVDGIKEGLANFNNIISNVVEFMELAGNIEMTDLYEKHMEKIDIVSEDSEDDNELDVK